MMNNGSLNHSLKVILAACLVCSLLVSTAAVMLSKFQKENQHQDKIKNILIAADLFQQDIENDILYQQHIEPVMIELNSGERVAEAAIGPDFSIETFNIETFANDPMLGENVAAEVDIAKIKRRPRFMVIYIVKTAGQVDKLILPVFGKGLWSTMYGMLALDRDLQTITGITFYQHGETPGLGGEIDNPRWQKQWQGKQAFDSNGRIVINVLRGEVDNSSTDANHQIDGLAGATLTSRGVNHLLHYWLGEHGYGPLLKKIQRTWQVSPLQKTGQ